MCLRERNKKSKKNNGTATVRYKGISVLEFSVGWFPLPVRYMKKRKKETFPKEKKANKQQKTNKKTQYFY